MFDIQKIDEYAETAFYLLNIVIVPMVGLQFWHSLILSRENDLLVRRQEEISTYSALDDKYIEYQKMALGYSKLDVAQFPLNDPPPLSEEEIIQQKILYTILISLFERAFLMYRDVSLVEKRFRIARKSSFLSRSASFFERAIFKSMDIKGRDVRFAETQWPGWEQYIKEYCKRRSFQDFWYEENKYSSDSTKNMDQKFEAFLHKSFLSIRVKHDSEQSE